MIDKAIKPVRNDIDYSKALELVDRYFDAKEGTPEADYRDVLIVLIEKYEDENYSIDLPDAVSAIKFRMEQKGLTQKDLIPYIGSRSKVSEVLSGKRDLSLKMIRALNKHLGIPAEVLLQDNELDTLENMADINFSEFPISEMKKNGAFDFISDIECIKDNSEELIRRLISNVGYEFNFSSVKFRKTNSTRLNNNLNYFALYAWFLHLLSAADKVKVSREYDADMINSKFISSLVGLSILDNGPKLAQEYLLKHGIILEIVHHYKKTYLDGAAYITPEGQPIIGLTLRYDRLDNFWFNLLHETAHIKKHLSNGNFIADDMSLRGSRSDAKEEKEADKFAEEALIPADFGFDKQDSISQSDVIKYSQNHNIHPAIIAGRIQYLKNNYRLFSNLIGRGEVTKSFQ